MSEYTPETTVPDHDEEASTSREIEASSLSVKRQRDEDDQEDLQKKTKSSEIEESRSRSDSLTTSQAVASSPTPAPAPTVSAGQSTSPNGSPNGSSGVTTAATSTPSIMSAIASVQASSSSPDNKPVITQHFTYEDVTKIAAAQAAATGILSLSTPAPSTSAVTMPSYPPVSSSHAIHSTVSPSGDSEIIEVSKDKVGQIIGSKGAVIQDMQTRTGAKIYVKQDINPCQVQINGNPQQVKAAADLVRRVILEGPTAIHVNSLTGGPTVQISLDCPQALVGRVIGGGGATIKELQTRSGAKIQIDQNFPDGVARKIHITGTQTAVTLATQLVSYVMEHGPSLPGMQGAGSAAAAAAGAHHNPYVPPAMSVMPTVQSPYAPPGPTMTPMSNMAPMSNMSQGGQTTHSMEVSKPMVGRIIGRGGETINMLQNKSGTRMQIDQAGNPCKVNITGTPQGINIAMQLISELIQNGSAGGGGGGGHGPSNPPAMTSMSPYGMPPVQPGYGGYPPPGGYHQPMMAPPGQYGYPTQQAPQQQSFQMPQPYPQMYGGVTPGVYGQPQPQMHYGATTTPAPAAYPTSMATAATASQPATNSPWSEHKTDDGNTYWYNSITGKSQWERPV